jgi:DNA-binding NtrC family response regulator
MSGENSPTYQTVGEESGPPKSKGARGPVPCLVLAAVGDDLLGGRERLIPVPEREILIGRGERDAVVSHGGDTEIRVRDNRMSGRHARIRRVRGGLLVEDLGSTNGSRINGAKIKSAMLPPGGYLELGRTFFIHAPFTEDEDIFPLAENGRLGPSRSVDPNMLAYIARARKIAQSQVSVLLLGESGTGKEVMAREIHDRSGRSGRMVAVHCGAIPENLLESELFGYKKGAFTGAVSSHEGLVAAADLGTLFLDEIGEMSSGAQVRLLRVLQEREILPVGDTHPRKVDIRLVAATNKDLRTLALSGKFRGDLYARLEGITFTLPRLCDRRGDLGILTAHFLRKFASEKATACAPSLSALRCIFSYNFPFNIRELEKVVEAAVALSGSERPIEPKDLPAAIRDSALPAPNSGDGSKELRPPSTEVRPLTPEEEELKARLVAALKLHDGNVSAVAREWGKARMQIQRWMKRFDLRGDTSTDEGGPQTP